MPDYNEQLAAIAQLRAEARRNEEALYGARVALQKLNQRLGRAVRGQVGASPQDGDADLRARIAQLRQQLADLREAGRAMAQRVEEIADQERLDARLTLQRTALQARIQERRALDADRDRSRDAGAFTDELALLERQLAQLDEVARSAAGRLEALRRNGAGIREAQAENQRKVESLRADLSGLQGRLAGNARATSDDPAAVRESIAQQSAIAERANTERVRLRDGIRAAIDGLYVRDPHPRGPLAQLSDQTPFLLLPVRLETIFSPGGRGNAGVELKVRIYPDEIAAHTHEATLTDREVDAGELYWTELVVAAHLRSERERRQRAAWAHVVNLFGGQRAAWIARNTKPSDWDDLSSAAESLSLVAFLRTAKPSFFTDLAALSVPDAIRAELQRVAAEEDADAFIKLAEQQAWGDRVNAAARLQITGFASPGLTKTDAWSRAPRTRVLPDRFVLLLYTTPEGAPRQIVGELIADTVFLGPDPLDPKDSIIEKDGARTLGGACAWMSDFDTAVAQGLAFRVPLSAEEARNGFARISVLGLRLSASAEQSALMLEELIENHQFSPKGFSLVAQGTPTNNTEGDSAGYSDNDPYDDLAFFTEVDPPAFDPTSTDPTRGQTDGRLLADALGVSYTALQSVQNAEQTDVLDARSMNTALFPSTLGYWLRRWMGPVITFEGAQLTRTFFTHFVTGRGPLPAVRVGNQPYGVLVTSDMSRWKYDEFQSRLERLVNPEIPYFKALHQILQALERDWSTLSAALPYVGKPGVDSSEALINILGLHPTSVQFFQRIGFSAEYVREMGEFLGVQSYINEAESLLRNMPSTLRVYLNGLGFHPSDGDISKTLAMRVVWRHYVNALDVPNLVDPKPPSETNKLTVNYIDWLAQAESTSKIVSEQFPAAAPSALLYLMLRNAVLLQLYNGSYDWLQTRSDFAPALKDSLAATTLVGVRASIPTLSKLELMNVSVELAEPMHGAPGTKVADWIWSGPDPGEAEAAFVKQQRAALERLATATTARLERAFIEHLDCCHYRLDAWETGLFAHRLQGQRRGGSERLERTTGIHLGAYGWVEDVRSTRRIFLSAEELPPGLRPSDDGPIMEEDDVGAFGRAIGSRRGGFVHAPSLNHAAAAALLRNAYLSHASSEQAEILSVNLSSQRVRHAQFMLEGVRNGQPIEALLGYQFERGLHDRTSRSAALNESPVLELNQFIQSYREAFPFELREIPQAGTEPATETVPPYSVVNGLKLTAATLSAGDGYGLSAVLAAAQWPNATQGAAILAERDALLDTFDAVKDLLTAENAYELVQGNFDRVAAVSLSQKEARAPQSLDVLNTPRGSQFTFTNRVTLHFDDLDPAAAASNPWPGSPMTPRALAEPGLNSWLGRILGAPERVRCEAYRVEKTAEGTETELDGAAVTLADLTIQPLDFIALVGVNAVEAGGATELETRIALHFRRAQGVGDDKIVRIRFSPSSSTANQLTFAQIFPLARRLRGLIGECRPLGAQDFLPAPGGKATAIAVDPTNPAGYDRAELRARVQGAVNALAALADALDGPAAPQVGLLLPHKLDDSSDDETFTGKLGDAFAKLDDAAADFAEASIGVTFSLADAEALATTLRSAARFGVSDAFPPEAEFMPEIARRAILSRARRVARRLRRAPQQDGILDRAGALLAAASPDKSISDQVASLLQAGEILFTGTLKYLPQFVCHNETDLTLADTARGQLLAHAMTATGLNAAEIVDEWLQGLARVRPRLHAWEIARTLAAALNDVALDMRPVQAPYRDKDSWLAVDFPEKDPFESAKPFGLTRDTLSIAAHGASAFQPGVPQCGLLLDEWTEEIPTTKENTGVAFRFNQPNAAPPQALLLAVTPEETGSWNWDDLVGTLADTLARAKRRAVEPEQLEKYNYNWSYLAPALVSEFTTLDGADVSLDYLVAGKVDALVDYYSVKRV